MAPPSDFFGFFLHLSPSNTPDRWARMPGDYYQVIGPFYRTKNDVFGQKYGKIGGNGPPQAPKSNLLVFFLLNTVKMDWLGCKVVMMRALQLFTGPKSDQK